MGISLRLRILLINYLAQNSVLREIEDEFESADIAQGPPSEQTEYQQGQRRQLVQRYYNSLDFADPVDIRKFLNVLSVFLGNLEHQIEAYPSDSYEGADYRRQMEKFKYQLRRDGYEYQSGLIAPITSVARLADAKAIAERFDETHIASQIRRIETSIETDPAMAIGTAKELVESCFKGAFIS